MELESELTFTADLFEIFGVGGMGRGIGIRDRHGDGVSMNQQTTTVRSAREGRSRNSPEETGTYRRERRRR